MADKLLTMKQVRERLGISENLLYRLIREDLAFKTLKVGRVRRMRELTLNTWIEQREQLESRG
jgi:excisionase family DNA binding protein